MIYLSPIIAIVLWIIAVKVWNFALNKYRSTGNWEVGVYNEEKW